MTTYPHIARYHEELRQLIEFGGSDNEQSIRRAFESCLTAYCREHKEKKASDSYRVLVHEAGHALGIRGSRDARTQDDKQHHPLLTDSVKSYSSVPSFTCSPTPFDVMAVYAIYQSRLPAQ